MDVLSPEGWVGDQNIHIASSCTVNPDSNASATVIRRATAEDVAAVTRCVCAAYLKYIERIGKQPWPMVQDYSTVIQKSQVHLADRQGLIVGVLELLITDQGFLLDSIAVDPSAQGTGVGRQLLVFAEAEAIRQGFESIYLMTNEKMTENQELYARIRSLRSPNSARLLTRANAQATQVTRIQRGLRARDAMESHRVNERLTETPSSSSRAILRCAGVASCSIVRCRFVRGC